ncbi:hypothetical protein SPONN_1143 [uncultured Candidatus Thioglobus sp.]|nr:hypothetical protein SPONN_1143 [uncultured Candidatus Thioglobus sp.]
MQLTDTLATTSVIDSIMKMNIDELETVKNIIIKRGLYLHKFKKDSIKNVIADFSEQNYTADFLQDLEDGLKKSSVKHRLIYNQSNIVEIVTINNHYR